MHDPAYAGAEFIVTEDENEAKSVAEFKKDNLSQTKALAKDKTTY